jgi:hypothetical protein
MELRSAHQINTARYNAGPKGRAAKARYRATPKGHAHDLATSAKRRTENPERHRAEFRSWYALRPPLERLLRTARTSAKKRNLEFSITEADLLPLPARCPIFGTELNYTCGGILSPRDKSRYNQASLDRKNNSLGYVPGNVFIVSWRANQLKSDGSESEHRAIAMWMAGG